MKTHSSKRIVEYITQKKKLTKDILKNYTLTVELLMLTVNIIANT